MNLFRDEFEIKVVETQDEFIFKTVQPFCEDAIGMRISKQELINALLLYERAKQLLGVKK